MWSNDDDYVNPYSIDFLTQLIERLIDWLTDWLTDWLINWLIEPFIAWPLIDWLNDWLIDGDLMIDWLIAVIDWSIIFLFLFLFSIFIHSF